ncbi:DUF1918 domain-containing protein [Kitasatospora sp. NPDC051853]|uniref:DUF1918 domain-containing protein n=1 Tax=Kitasatospora sp. NPDC051853 TaxID=3364058 RepID=UPI0037B95C67
MHATAGDHLVIHGRAVGMKDREGEILEVRGAEGGPPYWVHFEDGHDGLVYPGPDCTVIERQQPTH